MKTIITNQVKSCGRCDFFSGTPRSMECEHPIFKGKINERFSLSREDMVQIPAKCPLRDGDLVVEYSLFDEKEKAFLLEVKEREQAKVDYHNSRP